MNVKEKLKSLGYEFTVEGEDVFTSKFSSITDAGKNDITFCYYEENKAIDYLSKSDAGVILCKDSIKGKIHPKVGQQFYFLQNPRLAFIQIMTAFVNNNAAVEEISAKAVIDENATIGKNCLVHPFATIGKNCIIGDNCIIGKRVSIENCVIGNNCKIQCGTVIGEDGFAYERLPSEELEHFPHLGKVIIEDDVHIYANCCIARGSMTNTVIGEGTKIDSLVHIAHNVKIGKQCELTAGTVIGGSTTVGNSTWTGLNSTLKDNINVGNNVIVGAGAMVISNVSDMDVVAGVPAKSIKNKIKTNLTFLMAGQNDQYGQNSKIS